jgi:site-specific DNA-adenine methylase
LHQFLNEKQLERLERLQQLEQLERLQRLEQLRQLERLARLQQLQQLRQLQQLHFYNTSYENVPIKENSIIYCDIPYQGVVDYGDFNHKLFFDWAADQRHPVFISEYKINDDRFKQVFHIKKRSMLSVNRDKCIDKNEHSYANEAGVKAFFKQRM